MHWFSPTFVASTLVLLVALYLSVAWYSRRHVRRALERRPPVGRFVEAAGVRTHYLRVGTGPTVVLLHGLNGSLEDFAPVVIDELAADHDVVLVDRPGYGHTQRPRRDLSDPVVQAGWLEALLEALGIEEAVLVGHSWGGALTMTHALLHPDRVRALVLVGPYVQPGTEPDDVFHEFPRLPFMRSFIGHLFLVPVGRLIGPFFVRASFDPEPVPEGYEERWLDLTLRPSQFDTTLEEIRTIDLALANLAPRWPEVEVPVTVIAGDKDRSVDPYQNAQPVAEAMPQSELIWLEGAGHMVPWTRPGELVRAVRRLSGRDAPREPVKDRTGAR